MFDALDVETMAQRYAFRRLDVRQVGPDTRMILQPEPRA